MNRFLTAVAALTVAGAAAGASVAPEDQIARALAGRTAGKPTDCIWQRDIRSTQIVDRTAILYEMRDGTIILNRPTSGREFLRRDLALVTKSYSDQLCGVDIVRLYDPVARFENGSIGLGPFVPYARTR